MKEIKEYSAEEVAQHNTSDDVLVIMDNKVYDCTDFLSEHPGGDYIILEFAGQDATEAFEDTRHGDEARKIRAKLFVGRLKQESKS
ncbi:hypothetical protein NQ176_g333 [Zarea fungicola]|uniref:Uncharacterized protein n=1 Tax=Zarea fungicola TaxID=93591 RepID=A0ACC1NX70_9HYPO|nr:hypothetical protein NQ176_g333 [Lecanicillium fungicola]